MKVKVKEGKPTERVIRLAMRLARKTSKELFEMLVAEAK